MKLTTQLKDDWLWRLPERLDNMKFKGMSRPAYTLLCLIYYFVKDVVIITFVLLFRIYKLLFWDIWRWIFKPPEEDEYEEEEMDEPEYEGDDIEDLIFCQLFDLGEDMCLLIDHVEMCPDETAFIRVAGEEGYTPIYKRKVRRDKERRRFIVFDNCNYYLDDKKTQPTVPRKEKDHLA